MERGFAWSVRRHLDAPSPDWSAFAGHHRRVIRRSAVVNASSCLQPDQEYVEDHPSDSEGVDESDYFAQSRVLLELEVDKFFAAAT